MSFIYTSYATQFEKIEYQFNLQDPIDIVIPCHKKDSHRLDACINNAKKNIANIRRIIVISSEKFTDQAEWIPESIFPFDKKSLALEIFKSPEIASHQVHKRGSRMGWILQQFIKLFAAYYIDHVSSNVLVIDSDVIFLKPISFMQENGAGLYATGTENHPPYFDHMKHVLPALHKVYSHMSGVVHHMLFQKPVLDDLYALIEQYHNAEPWRVIARTIPVHNNEIHSSAMSEYEIYFNFVFARTNQVKIRPLKWQNLSNLKQLNKAISQGYDYVAIHIWNS